MYLLSNMVMFHCHVSFLEGFVEKNIVPSFLFGFAVATYEPRAYDINGTVRKVNTLPSTRGFWFMQVLQLKHPTI